MQLRHGVNPPNDAFNFVYPMPGSKRSVPTMGDFKGSEMKADDDTVQCPPRDGGRIREDQNGPPRKGMPIEQAETRTDEANLRTHQANTRTEEANTRTDQANTRTEEANIRTEHAELRTATVETQSRALRVSEISYRRLFEAARDGILILDFDTGRVADVNPFLVELLGFSHDEMVGKLDEHAVQAGGDDPDAVAEPL